MLCCNVWGTRPPQALCAAFFTAAALSLVRVLSVRGTPQPAIIFAFHACAVPLSLILSLALPASGAKTPPPPSVSEAAAAGGSAAPWASALLPPSFVEPTGAEWLCLLGTALAMEAAQFCMTRLLRLRTMGGAAPSSFLIVFWNVLLGVLLGDPLPGARTAVGCALICGPLAVVELRKTAPLSAKGAAAAGTARRKMD